MCYNKFDIRYFPVGSKVKLTEIPDKILHESCEDISRILKTVFIVTEVAADPVPEKTIVSIKSVTGVQKLVVPITILEPCAAKKCNRGNVMYPINQFEILNSSGYLSRVANQNLKKSDLAVQRAILCTALKHFKVGEVLTKQELLHKMNMAGCKRKSQVNLLSAMIRFDILQETDSGNKFYLVDSDLNFQKNGNEMSMQSEKLSEEKEPQLQTELTPVVKRPAEVKVKEAQLEQETQPEPKPQPQADVRTEKKFDYGKVIECISDMDDITFMETVMARPQICIAAGSRIKTTRLGGGKLKLRKTADISQLRKTGTVWDDQFCMMEDMFCMNLIRELMTRSDIKIAKGSCIHSFMIPGATIEFHKDFGKP